MKVVKAALTIFQAAGEGLRRAQAGGWLPRWRDPEGRVVVPQGFRASFKA